ncbi:MAG: EAL domain-containing protein [Sporichthyaceae bacterium]
MHQAIADGELVLHYQPKLDVRTGDVLGLEALVRWEHPTQGLIPPKAFIRVAEETGLVAPLGGWVLKEACVQMAGWHALGHDDLHVSVNVSARQFKLQDVPAVVRAALAESGLPPEALELELTESVGIDPDGSVGAALLELQAMGVRCSIDDFGTGYSSISYLHEYPVDTIKLDRSFVQDIGEGHDAPIVRAVIAMAHNLGLRVVAEGVETKAQLKFLEKHGCDEVQGFLFSRPLLSADVITFLDKRAAMSPAGRRRVPTMAVVALAAAAAAAMDEEALGRLLWEESELNAGEDQQPLLEEEEEDEKGRRGLMIFSMAAILLVPVMLGLGAGGGLPPTIQNHVSDVVDAAGVRPAEQAPVARPVEAAGPTKAPSTTRRKPAKGKPDASDGSAGRRRAALAAAAGSGPGAGDVTKPTVPKTKPVAAKPGKKPAAGGGPATRPRATTSVPPPGVTPTKPKGGNAASAPGKVKKSTAAAARAPSVTTTPLKGKGKKP